MSDALPTRPTWAEISHSALRDNFAVLAAQAKQGGAELVAVIKANAYGHGASSVLETVATAGCGWFAVTSLDEAMALRAMGGHERLLTLSGVFAGEAEETIRHGYTPVLASVEQLEWLAAALDKLPQSREPFRVHLEIDTGMARQGVVWSDKPTLAAFARFVTEHPRLALEGAMTHFAAPEDAGSSQTAEQLDRFDTALTTLRRHGCQPPLIHAGNSATLFAPAQMSALRSVAKRCGSRLLLRPGIALYGYGPRAAATGLKPVLTWKTRITALRSIGVGEGVSYNATFRAQRPTRIALLSVGYADGYNRLLSNRGVVLVRGQRTPVAGRVTMDQTTIDVTDVAEVAVGDEGVLLGTQGDQAVTADDIATATGTIAYEVLCVIGPRVPRIGQDRARS